MSSTRKSQAKWRILLGPNLEENQRKNLKITCKGCFKRFTKRGITTHYPHCQKYQALNLQSESESDTDSISYSSSFPLGKGKKRKRHAIEDLENHASKRLRRCVTNKTKLKVLEDYEKYDGEKKTFLRLQKIGKSSFKRWKRNKQELEMMTARELTQRKIKPILSTWKNTGIYPAQQKQLYDWCLEIRARELPLRHKFLRVKMIQICRQDAKDGILVYDEAKHKFRTGWTYRFCKRWDLSSQRKTKKNRHSIWKRYHKIQNYLYWLIYLLPIQPPAESEDADKHFGDGQMIQDRNLRQEHYVPKSAELHLGNAIEEEEEEEETSEDEEQSTDDDEETSGSEEESEEDETSEEEEETSEEEEEDTSEEEEESS